ncbi:MAG: redoxin domain-containing protein [Acidobacteriota bacterium]
MSEVLKIGNLVLDFEMETYDPKGEDFGIISLNQLKKDKRWVVLFFYPADYTFICPTELSDLAEKYAELKKLGVELISVSTDTKFVHLAWQREEKLLKEVKFPMGADPAGKISRLFGVYDENTGLAKRGTFILNPEGRLVGSEISSDNVGRNADELLRKIKAHLHVSAHPSEVCPAKWREGDPTLKPGAKLVGRVLESLKTRR